MRRHPVLVGFGLLLAAFAFAAPVRAADPLHDAKKRLSDAQTELTKAKVGVSLAAKKIQKQIEATPEWKQAASAAMEATNRYEASMRVAREHLARQPAYKAAIAELDKRVTEREALRGSAVPASADDGAKGANKSDSSPDPVVTAAVAVLNAQSAVRKIEQEAYAADPQVTKARSDLDDANTKLAELKKVFLEKVKGDPAFQSAQQQFQQASANYAQAAKDLDQAKKQQAAAESQKLDSDLDTQRQQMLDRAGWRR
jgi:predicted  nucleic acid-binding Zn-ribbon protein